MSASFAETLTWIAFLIGGLGAVKGIARLQFPSWPTIALLHTACIACAYIALTVAFIDCNWAWRYVASHSNNALPLLYRVAATWSGDGGSMLLWSLLFSLWITFVWGIRRPSNDQWAPEFFALALNAGWLLLLLCTANPFETFEQSPSNGDSLNPALQDPFMAAHPPFLYAGQAGLVFTMCIMLSGILHKRSPSRWASELQTCLLGAWALLTAGIGSGSYWAYHELGWGGWWTWDAVQNLSLLPWLTATAAFHCVIVTIRSGSASLSTSVSILLTGIFGLAASLLGRADLLSSIHAFSDQNIALKWLLSYIGLTLVIGATIVATGKTVSNSSAEQNHQTFVVAGAALLIFSAVVVLVGTVYPYVIWYSTGRSVVLGHHFFHRALVVPMLAVLAMGIIVSIRFLRRPRRSTSWAMQVGHVGLTLVAVAIASSTMLSANLDVRAHEGQIARFAGWEITLTRVRRIQAAEYEGSRATLAIGRADSMRVVSADRRVYRDENAVRTKSAAINSWRSNVLITLGEPLDEQTWAIKLSSRPAMRWLWLGLILLTASGFMAARQRSKKRRRAFSSIFLLLACAASGTGNAETSNQETQEIARSLYCVSCGAVLLSQAHDQAAANYRAEIEGLAAAGMDPRAIHEHMIHQFSPDLSAAWGTREDRETIAALLWLAGIGTTLVVAAPRIIAIATNRRSNAIVAAPIEKLEASSHQEPPNPAP